MAKRLFSSLLDPLDEWVLIRIPDTAADSNRVKLLVAEKNDNGKLEVSAGGPLKRNTGIVVSVGPGHRADNGELVPVDKRIAVGATIIFPGKTAFRPPDIEEEMREEGLWFIPASTVVCVMRTLPTGQTVVT